MFSVLQDMWGGWSGTRLPPRRFALLYFVSWLFLILIGGLALLLGAAMFGGHGQRHADPVVDFAGLLGVGLLLWFAALFNISVKRCRDIGIPGFVAGILFILLLVVGGISIFASILLALVPADTFATNRA
jgi:hypothetical protein